MRTARVAFFAGIAAIGILAVGAPAHALICGDGVLDVGEQCDDSNTADGDCCSALCLFEIATNPCDDGNACTQTDQCDGTGTCVGANPVICTALDQCHDVGTCNTGTGICSNPPKSAGASCNDTNACTQTDQCDGAGICVGANPVVCTALSQCHDIGTCNTGTGICSNPPKSAGAGCDDTNACTQTDQCNGSGTCVGGNPVVCTALDQCHVAGTCNTGTGLCSNPNQPDGTPCNDGAVCTIADECTGGTCGGNTQTCGDGVTQGTCGETCDDANAINGDGCDTNCLTTGCGNGIVTTLEQCDDGNLTGGDGCSPQCQREFLNPVPAAGDHFGESVAMLGTNLVVGTPFRDQPNAINTGTAYLMSGATGAMLRQFQNPTPNPGDRFGYAVTTVGIDVVVGAPFDDTVGPDAGAVYLYDGSTGALLRTFVNPSPGTNDHFGASLAAFGSNILIGAPLDLNGLGGGGIAYLYNANTGSVIQVFLNPSPAAGDEFGTAVAGAGSQVWVGAPRHDEAPQGQLPGCNDCGAVYAFNPVSGALIRKISNPGPSDGDLFGRAVAPFGTNLLVGAPVIDGSAVSSGAAYLFNSATGAVIQQFFSPTPTLNDEFGISLAAVGTDKIVVGARRDDASPNNLNTGSAFLFHAASGSFLQTFTKSTPVSDDQFGAAVASVGSRIFVGTPLDDSVELDAGAVYSFEDLSCGNGITGPGEQCDDGNVVSGDGCDSNCRYTACGNGIVTPGEACDDGNTTAGDGCSPSCAFEGVCGDGVLSPFEGCDDGNLVSGDGCDANCTPTGCGNGIQTSGEGCDHGANNGIDLCCSTACQPTDGDGDGVCDQTDNCPTVPNAAQSNGDGDVFGDACDICPGDTDNDSDDDLFCIGSMSNPPAVAGGDPCSRANGAGDWYKPKALIGRAGLPFGDEKFRLKGYFTIGTTLPHIAPDRYGVQLRVADRFGNLLADEHIPGGLYTKATRVGWKDPGEDAKKWIFLDKTEVAQHNGIRKFVVKDLSRIVPGRIGVFMKAKGSTYPLVSIDQPPVRVTVELNDTALPSGGTPGRDQCGEVAFGLPPLQPSCAFAGTNLICK